MLESDELDELGMVTDYHNLSRIKDWIDETLDHQNLNDVFSFHTTAENLAASIFSQCFNLLRPLDGFGVRWRLKSIGVSETTKTWAEYNDE